MKYENILTQVAKEDMFDYDFREAIGDGFDNDIAITGNRDYIEYGNETAIEIIKRDYYDDDENENGEAIGYDYEVEAELEKVTGKKWHQTCMRGYSQSDWQYLYYTDEVSDKMVEFIEDAYMGKLTEYHNETEDCWGYYVPDDIAWKGKEAVCEYLGYDPATTLVRSIVDSKHHEYWSHEYDCELPEEEAVEEAAIVEAPKKVCILVKGGSILSIKGDPNVEVTIYDLDSDDQDASNDESHLWDCDTEDMMNLM